MYLLPVPIRMANFFAMTDDYRHGIYVTDESLSRLSAVKVAPLDRPIGFDYDVIEDRFYWTDFESGVIRRVFSNGSDIETIRNLRPGLLLRCYNTVSCMQMKSNGYSVSCGPI